MRNFLKRFGGKIVALTLCVSMLIGQNVSAASTIQKKMYLDLTYAGMAKKDLQNSSIVINAVSVQTNYKYKYATEVTAHVYLRSNKGTYSTEDYNPTITSTAKSAAGSSSPAFIRRTYTNKTVVSGSSTHTISSGKVKTTYSL